MVVIKIFFLGLFYTSAKDNIYKEASKTTNQNTSVEKQERTALLRNPGGEAMGILRGLDKLPETNVALKDINDRLKELDVSVKTLEGELKTLTGSLPELSEPLPLLGAGVGDLQKTVELLNKEVQDLAGKVDPLAKAVDPLTGEVSTLNTNLGGMDNTLKHLAKALGVLTTTLSVVNALLLNVIKPVLTIQTVFTGPVDYLNNILADYLQTLTGLLTRVQSAGTVVDQISKQLKP